MRLNLVAVPVLLALVLVGCSKKQKAQTIGDGSTPAPGASASRTSAPPTAVPVATPTPPAKVAIDQTAQVIIFCYHRLVDKVRYPGTEIRPADFEAQMKALKDRGITVIGMQDFLAWRRSEKNIPARSAIVTFDDGWKSQYDVAWPIMKKFGYPMTLFIYTEGVRGGSLGGGEAITWEQLAEMRDAGVDIQAHSATHQDLREGHPITVVESGKKRTRKKLTGAEYEQWLHNEVVGCKELLEQRLAIRVNCFAVPFGNYNEHVKEIARNAGYEAMFTVYGQPITFRSPMDSVGRYAIEANKPKVFEDAVSMIGSSAAGGAPVAEISATNLATKPGDGETIRNPMPLISANLSAFGQIDPGSVQMRVSGLGVVPASFDAKTNTASYQVTQKLRDRVSVVVEAKSGGKKVQGQWSFAIDGGAAPNPAATVSPSPKK